MTIHSSEILLDKSALQNNIMFLREFLNEGVIFSSVVKGNAYGHGIESFIPLAEECGVNHFSVYSADEAVRVKMVASTPTTVLVMGYVDPHQLRWCIENKVEFFVFDFERLHKALEVAREIDKKAILHIELETGMNRTGFEREDLEEVARILNENRDHLFFKGLCTHYAGAESIANYVRYTRQKEIYLEMLSFFESNGLTPEQRHTCCSAAAIRMPEMQMDMVRIGILQYGFWPSREVFIEYIKDKFEKGGPLKRIITWKSKVMSLKNVSHGEFIGYGTTFLAQSDMTIALLPIGYAHGFTRGLSNTGRALINGKRVPVVGMVNMNCIAINVTDVDNVKPGDEVILIGKQKNVEISVSAFGELSTQLNYELLTRLPHDIPRNIKI
ncbi:alanine racemase [Halocola ammonii]